ncbi:unnamed protein product [Adineta ricciae]|uniref:EGF-like domain-containing protein n=1 Tax=Adineta ricciae TaxID=249248 RepID=A0A815E1A8_ADIRI|nr:unnamed protein product [Adineta ricciae]
MAHTDQQFRIVIQPQRIYRERYRSEQYRNGKRPPRFILAEDNDSKIRYPTIELSPNRRLLEHIQINSPSMTCSPPCIHGGTCDPTTAACICVGQWSGVACATCGCQNGGTCNPTTGACACVGQWSGTTCTTCGCQNGGSCDPATGACACVGQWSGTTCTTCGCQHGGTCGPTTGACTCVGQWGGTTCTTCGCQNGGSCSPTTGACACVGQWSGTTCTTCGCQTGGSCDPATGACTCVGPWGGTTCTTCGCQHGGTCGPTTGTCSCVGQWSGTTCTTCGCQHGGTCGPTTGACTCVGQWGGTTCTTFSCETVAGDSNGSSGVTAGLLYYPYGVYVDSAGNVYVADTYNSRIQKWAPGATSGITVAGDSGGSFGIAAGLLYYADGVYVDSAGNMYVADNRNSRIQKWAPGATSGITVAGDSNGSYGSTAALLYYPIGVYVDSAGNVYIADYRNSRIQKWAPGATSGITVAGDSNGSSGVTAALLHYPFGVYVDSAGNVYVADTYNHRIQKWAPGATSGITVAGDSTGSYGVTAALLHYPIGVYVDSAGNVYVADYSNHRIQKWAPGATNGITVVGSSSGSSGVTAGLLYYPYGVYVDSAGNMYVADTYNSRIQKCF